MAAPIISRAQAKANGLLRYFTGNPCKRNHISERKAVDGQCIECTRVASMDDERIAAKRKRAKVWDDRHREEKNARSRERYQEIKASYPDRLKAKWQEDYRKNPTAGKATRKRWNDANKERMKAYRLANKEKFDQYGKDWQKQNADRVRDKCRKWYRANTENSAKRRKANPEPFRAAKLRYRARLASADGSHTAVELKELFAKQNGECAYCRASLTKRYHADHIVALSKGGSNWISNIQLTCGPCNVRKWTLDHDEYVKRLAKQEISHVR